MPVDQQPPAVCGSETERPGGDQLPVNGAGAQRALSSQNTVMVWVVGGAYKVDSADGRSRLVPDCVLVAITVNYRYGRSASPRP